MSTGTRYMPRQKRDDTAVKIATRIYRKAKMVAAHRDIPIAEFLSNLLEKPVDREYRRLLEELGSDSANPDEA